MSTRPGPTEGRPTVTGIITTGEWPGGRAVAPRGGVERALRASFRLAIVEAATVRSLPVPDVTDFDSPVGRGVIGTVEGRVLVLGSSDFNSPHRHRRSQGTVPTSCAATEPSSTWEPMAGSVDLFAIADPIKATRRPR